MPTKKELKIMTENKINIHITDADFDLKNSVVSDTEIRNTGSAYGRFLFTEFPKITILNTRFINSYIRLSNCGRNSLFFNNLFTFAETEKRRTIELRRAETATEKL